MNNQVQLEIRDRGLFTNESMFEVNSGYYPGPTPTLDSSCFWFNDAAEDGAVYELQEFTLSTYVKFLESNGMFFTVGADDTLDGGLRFEKVGGDVRIRARLKHTKTLDSGIDETEAIGWTVGTMHHVFIKKVASVITIKLDNVLVLSFDMNDYGTENDTVRYQLNGIPATYRRTGFGGFQKGSLFDRVTTPLNMNIDETAFFSFALNESEEAHVYNGGKPLDLNESFFLNNDKKLLAWFRDGDKAVYSSGSNSWSFPNESYQNSQPAFARLQNEFVSPTLENDVVPTDSVTQVADNELGVIDLKDHTKFPLALTYSISNISNINTRSGIFSKRFKVPATHLNNKTLKNLHNINLVDIDSVKAERRGIVRVNGIKIFDGLIRIKNIIYQGDTVHEYEFLMIGNNLDWVTRLKGLKLNQIDLGAVEYTPQAVGSGWAQQPTTPTRLVVYPLVCYGALHRSDTVSLEDLRPALFLREWLRRIFDRIGYTISSDFIDGTYTPNGHDFRQFIYPIVAKGAYNTQEYADRFNFKAVIDATLSSDSVNGNVRYNSFGTSSKVFTGAPLNGGLRRAVIETDTGGYYDLSGVVSVNDEWRPEQYGVVRHTATLNGVKWFISFQAALNTGATEYSIQVMFRFVYGNSITLASQVVTLTSANKDQFTGSESIELDTGFYSHEKGKEIAVEVSIGQATNFTNHFGNYANSGMHISGGTWTCEPSRNFARGQSIRPNDYLSDAKSQFSLINGLTGLFNLHFDTDTDTKTVTIEPRDNFYKPISEAIDWSDKIDLSTNPVINILSDYKQQLTFQYQDDDEDKFVSEYERIYKENLGAYLHTLSNRFPQGDTSIGTKYFSYTDSMRLRGAGFGSINSTTIKPFLVARMWAEYAPEADLNLSYPETHHVFAPRILDYKQFTYQGAPLSHAWRWENAVTLQAPIALTIDSESREGANLHYQSVIMDGTTHPGLFETYFASTIGIIEKGSVLNCKIYLTESDIENLDLRLPIFLRHPELYGYWVIDKITDYRPHKTQSTKVRFVRHENLEPARTFIDISIGAGVGPTGGHTGQLETDVGNTDENDDGPFSGTTTSTGGGINTGHDIAIAIPGGGTTTAEIQGIKTHRPGVDQGEQNARNKYETQSKKVADETSATGYSLATAGHQELRYNPSFVLENGSRNQARRGAGSVVLGRGLISNDRHQAILGRYNNPNSRDAFQFGIGTGEGCRETALSVTRDGMVRTYGGEIIIFDEADGSIRDVIITDENNSFTKVYRSSYDEGEEMDVINIATSRPEA